MGKWSAVSLSHNISKSLPLSYIFSSVFLNMSLACFLNLNLSFNLNVSINLSQSPILSLYGASTCSDKW